MNRADDPALAEAGQHGVFAEGVHIFNAPILAVNTKSVRYSDPITRQPILCERSRLLVAMDTKAEAKAVVERLKRAYADYTALKREASSRFANDRAAIITAARNAKIGGRVRPGVAP